MRIALTFTILAFMTLLALPVGQVHASTNALTTGENCADKQYCIYDDPRLDSGVASLTVVPRFYHMAQQCYLQGAMMATIAYHNKLDEARWTPGATGVQPTWELDTFCVDPVQEGDTVLNQHVLDNMLLLYKKDSYGTPLQTALKNFDARFVERPEEVLASTSMQTPERMVSDILWREYISYAQYLGKVDRQPDDFQRAATWASGVGRSGGSAVWNSFLTDQILLLSRIDNTTDLQIATATRYVAEILYTELVRTYQEHLEYLKMRDSFRGIANHMDRIERAFATLSIKLPDAYIIGN